MIKTKTQYCILINKHGETIYFVARDKKRRWKAEAIFGAVGTFIFTNEAEALKVNDRYTRRYTK